MFYKNTRGHFEGYFYKIKEIRKSREYSTVAWEKRSGNWEIHIKLNLNYSIDRAQNSKTAIKTWPYNADY